MARAANVRTVMQDTSSDLKIATVETFRLRLPYKSAIAFRSVRQSAAEYVILRVVLVQLKPIEVFDTSSGHTALPLAG